MSTREQDLKPCARCGRERRVHQGRKRAPAEYCRECSPHYGTGGGRLPTPCPDCGETVGGPGAPMWHHRRTHHPEVTR